eukprot:SAG31_NODE_923_length_10969_cov_6.723091_7_plen_412_part_00
MVDSHAPALKTCFCLTVLLTDEETSILTDLCPDCVQDQIRICICDAATGEPTTPWSQSWTMPSATQDNVAIDEHGSQTMLFRIPHGGPSGMPVRLRAFVPKTGCVIFNDDSSSAPFQVVNHTSAVLEYMAPASLEPFWQSLAPGLAASIWTEAACESLRVEIRQLQDGPDIVEKGDAVHARPFMVYFVDDLGDLPKSDHIGISLMAKTVLAEGIKTLVLQDGSHRYSWRQTTRERFHTRTIFDGVSDVGSGASLESLKTLENLSNIENLSSNLANQFDNLGKMYDLENIYRLDTLNAAASSVFFDMEGFQVSFCDKMQREYARFHASNFKLCSVPTGTLHVTVLMAYGLPFKDTLTQSNDAYCVVDVDGETRTTQVIETSKAPTWAQEHDIGELSKYTFHFCTWPVLHLGK